MLPVKLFHIGKIFLPIRAGDSTVLNCKFHQTTLHGGITHGLSNCDFSCYLPDHAGNKHSRPGAHAGRSQAGESSRANSRRNLPFDTSESRQSNPVGNTRRSGDSCGSDTCKCHVRRPAKSRTCSIDMGSGDTVFAKADERVSAVSSNARMPAAYAAPAAAALAKIRSVGRLSFTSPTTRSVSNRLIAAKWFGYSGETEFTLDLLSFAASKLLRVVMRRHVRASLVRLQSNDAGRLAAKQRLELCENLFHRLPLIRRPAAVLRAGQLGPDAFPVVA